MKQIIIVLLLSCFIFSCEESELVIPGEVVGGVPTNNGTGGAYMNDSPTLIDQEAQGNFMGTNFIYSGGTYFLDSIANIYHFNIYVNHPINTDNCIYPQYEDGANREEIKFSTPSTSTGSYDVQNNLIFHQIVYGETTQTIVESAIYGIFQINLIDENTNTLTGTILGKGNNGSEINGNINLEFCE